MTIHSHIAEATAIAGVRRSRIRRRRRNRILTAAIALAVITFVYCTGATP